MAIPARYLNAIGRGDSISREALLSDLNDLSRAVGWLMTEQAVRPEDKTIVRRRRCCFAAAQNLIDALLMMIDGFPLFDKPLLQTMLLAIQRAVDGLVELTRKNHAHTQ